MNVVNVWLEYQGINRTAETQSNFYNYLTEEMIDNNYNRFMIRSAERRRRKFFDSDEETSDDDKPLFVQTNSAPRFGISLHVIPTKKSSNKMDGIETQ